MNDSARSPRRVAAQRVLAALLLAAVFFSLTTPIDDPDFWWHLAAGRWIWEHRSFPATDPFSFAFAQYPQAIGNRFLFTYSWGAELLSYALWRLGGADGVILLRACTLTALFALLLRHARRLGTGLPAAAAIVGLAAVAIPFELLGAADRPQLWSTLLFPATVVALERMKAGSAWAHGALPLLLLAWANLHGGYLIGVLAVIVYAAAALRSPRRRSFLTACALAVLATGCTPNGFSTLLSYPALRLSPQGDFLANIVEERSFFDHASPAAIVRAMPAFCVLLALSALTIVVRFKHLARERVELLALYLATLALGVRSLRFMVFSAATAALVCALGGASLSAVLDRVPRLPGAYKSRSFAAAAALLFVAGLAVWFASSGLRFSALMPGRAPRHPYAAAADFLESNRVQGRLFAETAPAGYLLWRLAPGLSVFAYGRLASPEQLERYLSVVYDPYAPAKSGVPRYAEFFRDEGIEIVALPGCDTMSGAILPLVNALAKDAGWAAVHADATVLVFLRATSGRLDLLRRAQLPKTAVYDTMISVATAFSATRHGRVIPDWRNTLAYAWYARGDRAQALRWLDEYLALRPKDADARAARDRIAGELRDAAAGSGQRSDLR